MIYRKGDDQSSLFQRAEQQRKEEGQINRSMRSNLAKFERDIKTGVQGAKNITKYNPTVEEATENPVMFGGPVSGAELAKRSK
jgi:hypothetical protein